MNYRGEVLKAEIFGSSHAEKIGVRIWGLPAGLVVDSEKVNAFLALRAPGNSPLTSSRHEPDEAVFESGVVNGVTDGGTLCAVIYNRDVRSSDYAELYKKPRPSHADYPAYIRYGDEYDHRGGGVFSGRMTAPLCIAGAIALSALENEGIRVGAHLLSVGTANDRLFSATDDENTLIDRLSEMPFAVIDETAGETMKEVIREAALSGDSVGGVIEGKITGLPVGWGGPLFEGLESSLASALFAVPAVKGVEFGEGFAGSKLCGSVYNDAYYYDGEHVKTRTNHAGGLCGGMTTGMPVIFRAAVKPTPSIGLPQDTVDLDTKTNTVITIGGRHDPCVALRALHAIRAAASLVIFDTMLATMLAQNTGKHED